MSGSSISCPVFPALLPDCCAATDLSLGPQAVVPSQNDPTTGCKRATFPSTTS